MVFIWRGFGIVVPIILLISGWITSYWFEDTRLGNSTYLGWTMLWAGIVLILAALAALGGNLDENGEKIPKEKKSHNDFFWIPIWVWSLGFIGFGIYFIYKEVPKGYGNYNAPVTTEDNSYAATQKEEVVIEDRALYLYNCAADSIEIEIVDSKDNELYDFYVQNSDYSYVEVTPDDYTVKMDGSPYEIELEPATKRNEDYNDAWMVLCGGVDLVLVEVTEICKEGIDSKEVSGIDWTENVVERFSGDDLIEPQLFSSNGGGIRVVAPNTYLPQELEKNQKVYVLIKIGMEEDVTEKFLDDQMIYLSIR